MRILQACHLTKRQLGGMALAAHLLYDRLEALRLHCSDMNAPKPGLATDIDYVTAEVRALLGLEMIDELCWLVHKALVPQST